MTNDYVSLFITLNVTDYSGEALMSLLMLTIARLFPILTLSSFLGGKVLPRPVKVSFGLALFAILFPKLILVTDGPIPFNTWLLVLFLKELLIGGIIGILVSVPFWSIEAAGMFTDHQRGGAALNVQDPLVQSQSSPLGTMYNLTAIYLFWVMDGPFLFLDGIMDSYTVVPPDQMVDRIFFHKDVPLWQTTIELVNRVMKIAIQLASPALLVILMTDFFLGVINRMAPQVIVTFLGMPLKSLLAMGVVCIGWTLMAKQFTVEMQTWFIKLINLIKTFNLGIT